MVPLAVQSGPAVNSGDSRGGGAPVAGAELIGYSLPPMPEPMTSEAMYEAAEKLTHTDKGRLALKGLRAFIENGFGLDSPNQRACMTLFQGFFGSLTGSAVEAVRERTEAVTEWAENPPKG